MGSTSIALVTGASNGIGRAVAERFAADLDYDRVALLDIDSAVEGRADSLDGASGHVLDLRDQEAVDDVVETLETEGRIDAVVNNAGVSAYYWLGDLDLEEWHRVLDTNLTGQYNVLHAVGPRMYEREHGYVVNVSSGAGQRGSASGGVHYSASKAGVLGLTKGTAKQLAPHVHVNAVVPGLVDTRLTADPDLWSEDELAAFTDDLPARRLGEPDEIARVIQYFCGDGAAYMTGSVVNVDGGGSIA
ncbi:SDR family NAD(P)-dependent oxidoreductase [Halococcus sp. IIIV-5B]|uniref:SDR family NAD(P)-dependent oxidoreductase n=1 Tax=Halococcus sp. IIIV-5B TaxID=2321230 RepID=UPI000E72F7E2|nr:SDR family NAD(P)-dependent oxidoreductase [Halococcus sp. IIIV-5B]RJT07877.1 SDR family oxidoreductase [Halococcus sp. IIIV-5B]